MWVIYHAQVSVLDQIISDNITKIKSTVCKSNPPTLQELIRLNKPQAKLLDHIFQAVVEV